MSHALFHLAADPDLWMPPLREEVERVVKEDGWTKVQLTHDEMHIARANYWTGGYDKDASD
jgi:hypothetical protein